MAGNYQFQADDRRRTVKSCTDKLMRCVNSLDARLSRERRDSSDVARRQGDGGRNNDGRIALGVANIEKQLDDVQEILDAVSELTKCCSNGNHSYSTINYLGTRKTSIMKDVKDVINATCESIFLGTRTGNARTTTVGVKRGREDVERDADERCATKRQKTRHGDNASETSSSARTHVRSSDADEQANRSRRRNAETARTTSVEKAKRERDAAEWRKNPSTRRDGGEGTRRTVAATDENANRSTTAIANDVERKSQFSVVVVNELNPYYKRDVFATVELFRFMARTIVHRLMDSTLRPDEHAIRLTIRQLMPERKITSENEILTLLHPFFK